MASFNAIPPAPALNFGASFQHTSSPPSSSTLCPASPLPSPTPNSHPNGQSHSHAYSAAVSSSYQPEVIKTRFEFLWMDYRSWIQIAKEKGLDRTSIQESLKDELFKFLTNFNASDLQTIVGIILRQLESLQIEDILFLPILQAFFLFTEHLNGQDILLSSEFRLAFLFWDRNWDGICKFLANTELTPEEYEIWLIASLEMMQFWTLNPSTFTEKLDLFRKLPPIAGRSDSEKYLEFLRNFTFFKDDSPLLFKIISSSPNNPKNLLFSYCLLKTKKTSLLPKFNVLYFFREWSEICLKVNATLESLPRCGNHARTNSNVKVDVTHPLDGFFSYLNENSPVKPVELYRHLENSINRLLVTMQTNGAIQLEVFAVFWKKLIEFVRALREYSAIEHAKFLHLCITFFSCKEDLILLTLTGMKALKQQMDDTSIYAECVAATKDASGFYFQSANWEKLKEYCESLEKWEGIHFEFWYIASTQLLKELKLHSIPSISSYAKKLSTCIIPPEEAYILQNLLGIDKLSALLSNKGLKNKFPLIAYSRVSTLNLTSKSVQLSPLCYGFWISHIKRFTKVHEVFRLALEVESLYQLPFPKLNIPKNGFGKDGDDEL